MRRPLKFLFPSLVALALTTGGLVVTTLPTSAAPIAGAPTTYCGDPDTDPSIDTGAGTMITCDTTITNTITAIDPGTGVASGSSVISVTECTGPASGRLDPSMLTCSTDAEILVSLVTHVDQCNGVGYGGGNVLECSVSVINNFVGVTPQALSAATVNQCNASAPDTTGCNPFPATTTNATITQCNNSSYGGGQEDFNCTASGTTTSSLTVTVNQCNDSNYGGGSWLNCSASLLNNVISLVTASPTDQPTLAPTDQPTLAPTDQPTLAPTDQPTLAPTDQPTLAPTDQPTLAPTLAPVAPSVADQLPDVVTAAPSLLAPQVPVHVTSAPQNDDVSTTIALPETDSISGTPGAGSNLALIVMVALALGAVCFTRARSAAGR